MTLQFKRSVIASAVLLASVGLTGCGGGSGGSTTTPTQPTQPTNSAPTAITLSANVVEENAVAATIGGLTATDPDTGDTITFTVDDERFAISGSDLVLAADTYINYESESTVDINVTATDAGGLSFTQAFTIEVTDLLDTFKFASRFTEGESSVVYNGQIARHVLIADLYKYIDGQLKDDANDNKFSTKEEVLAKLHSYYKISDVDYDEVVGDRALILSTGLGNEQTTMKQLSSSHKDLSGKIAGNDAVGQHKDWSTAMVGWNEAGSVSPEGAAMQIMDMIADNVMTYIGGAVRNDPNGNAIDALYVNEDGKDLNQLLQKFLLGAVAFSQAADDYLDDSVEGKGLLSDNTVGDKDGTKPYTALEHSYDEGFGYFGAARNYNDYTDDEVAGKDGGRENWKGHHDTDGNGKIDLLSEYNFHNSTNAAKRDRGTAARSNPTDYSKVIFDAFLKGREIITTAGGALSDEQMSALQAQRDIIVLNWEKAISATVVHYINDTIGDMEKIGTDDYDFATHAKHWSEMKGFALNFQFNPRTPVSAEDFAKVHELMGMAPELSADGVEAYKAKLLEARDILQNAYGFDAENVANW